MKKTNILNFAVMIFLFSAHLDVWGQTPPGLMNFQGRLTDAANNPLTGPQNFTFRIYDAPAGGTQLWTETQAGITVTNGVLSVQLGAGVPLTADIFNGGAAYLEITVGGVTLSPRQRLVTSAYAFNAHRLEGRSYAAFVTTDAAAGYADGPAVGAATATLRTDLNAVALSTGPLVSYANWNTAFGWGNHALAGYTDGSAIGVATATLRTDLNAVALSTGPLVNYANWDTAYGWGNHGAAGYAQGSDLTTEMNNRISADNTIGMATGTLRGDLNAVALSTGPLVNYANWDTAYGWGNHALAGYTDGSAIGAATATLRTDLNAVALSTGPLVSYANWNTAFGWGNHASAGYTSGSAVGAATATLRTDLNTLALSTGPLASYANWNTAYGWGNHASAGYVALDSSQTFTAQNAFQNQVTISSNLFVMTGNVGIGTTEPGSRLEVAGGSSTFRGSDANSAIAGFTDAGGNYRVVISTAGNVGIGTASPEHLLDVRGNIHSNSELTVEAAIANIIATSPGVTAFYHTNDASGALLKVDGNWPIRFNTNSNERMRIDGSGSVGIGTTGPGTKLDVAGNAQFGQGVLKSTFTAVPGGSDYALYLSSGLYLASGGIRWADNTVSTTAGAGGGLGGAALLAATQTFTGGGTFTSTAAFTAQNASAPGVTISSGLIVSAGNVGIGTLNPGSKLEVTGFVTAGTGVGGEGSAQMGTWAPATTYAFWGNGALNQTISTNYALRQHTGGTTVVNAGAGTTLYLGVGDNTYMYFQGSDAVISNKNLTVSNGSIVTTGGGIMEAGPGSAAAPAYRFAGFTNTGLFALTGPVLGFTTGGVEQMRIESSGNVGIGTISPTSKLEVDGVLTVSGTPARIIIDGGSESVINFMGSGSVFDGQINTKPDKSMWFYAGGDSSAPKMAIANTGNFGVGTATPDAILHISSISASAAQDMLKVTTGTANADVFVVKGSGNVGIGTTNPANGRLSIQTLSTTQNPVWIQNPSAQSRFAVELLNDYLNLYMYNNTGAQGVVLRTDGNNSFIKTGNVGIGTAGPGAKLDVEGSAQFGQGVMKSTFTAVPGGSEYALYLSSGLYLASGGIRWADNTVSTTAVAGGGLGGAELLVATQTFTGANTFTSTAAFTAQNASAPGVTISSGLVVTAGNVGIGTTGPAYPLTIAKDVSSGSGIVIDLSGSTLGADNTDSYINTGLSTWKRYSADSDWLSVGGAAGTVWSMFGYFNTIYSRDGNGNMTLIPQGSGDLVITNDADTDLDVGSGRLFVQGSSGNVGIGTANPLGRLDIYAPDNSAGSGAGLKFTLADAKAGVLVEVSSPTSPATSGTIMWTDNIYGRLKIGSPGGVDNQILSLEVGGAATTNNEFFAYDRNAARKFMRYFTDTGHLSLQPTAGNVGVGTTSPETKLHIMTGVDQNIKFSAFINGSNGTALTASNDNPVNKNNFEIIANDILLTPTGNVGVGTTSPGAKLDVNGTIRSVQSDGVQFTRSGNWFTISDAGGYSHLTWFNYYNGANWVASHAVVRPSKIYGDDSGLHFQTSPTLGVGTVINDFSDKFTVLNGGNVGIGTANPTSMLQIQNSSNRSIDTYTPGSTDGLGANHIWSTDTTGATKADIAYFGAVQDGAAQRSGKFYWQVGNSGAPGVVMTLNKSGNLGIGTTGPDAKLVVNGDIVLPEGSGIYSDNGGALTKNGRLIYREPATDIIHIGSPDYANPLYIDPYGAFTGASVIINPVGGNVGIGMTNPGYKLDVAGTMNAQEVRVNGVVLSPGTGSNWTVSGPDVYRNGGKVGIGTTAPGEKLDVSGGNIKVTGLSAAQSSIYLNKPAASDAQALTFQTGGTDKWNLGVRANNSYLEFWDSPAGTSMLTIAASGSVGIGTAGPGAKLDVRGTDTQAYSLAVGTSTAYSLVVSTNGKVGIGVAEPGANLHVGADTAGRSMIKSGATFENSYLLLSRTGDDATIVNKNDGTLRINHSGSSTDAHLVILNTGNVGIGTANPASSFEVQGTGITLGGVTRTTWPSGSGTGFGTDAGTYAYYTGGNVGIGTAAPEAKLHVYSAASAEHLFETGGGQNFLTVKSPGTTTLNSALRLRSGAKTTELAISAPDNGTGQAGDLYVWDADDGAVRLIVKDGGNVGIGTTGPGSLLHVSGSGARISVQTTDNGVLPGYQWKNAVGSTIGTFTQSGGTGNFSLDTAAGGIGNIMTMLYSSGNVGIGTADPQARLDVGSAGGDISLGYNYTGTNILRKSFTTAHAAGNVPAALAIGTDDGAWAGITINSLRDGAFNSQSIAFDTHHGGVSVGTRMTIDKDGNVGIGTAAPQGLLHVSGSLARIYVQKPDASANRGLWRFNADTDGVFSLQAINDAFSSAYNAFTITRDGTNGIASVAFPNGNVGIGVTDPKVVLQAGSAANRIGAEPRTDGMAIGGVAASNSARVGGFYNANPIPGAAIHFGAQGAGGQRGAIAFLTKALDDDATQPSAQMVITNGGDVGIGTTNPSAKLEVAGDIKANNFQNSWTAYAPTTSLGHTGCTGRYIVQGKIVYVQLYVPGQALTTGAASWSMSLPLTSASNLPTELSRTVFINASSTRQTGVLIINTSASSVDVYAAPSLPPWSSAGTGSGIAGTLISYPID